MYFIYYNWIILLICQHFTCISSLNQLHVFSEWTQPACLVQLSHCTSDAATGEFLPRWSGLLVSQRWLWLACTTSFSSLCAAVEGSYTPSSVGTQGPSIISPLNFTTGSLHLDSWRSRRQGWYFGCQGRHTLTSKQRANKLWWMEI